MSPDEITERAKQLVAEEIARYKVAESTDAYRLMVMFQNAAVRFEVYRGPGATLEVVAPEAAIFLFAADGHLVSMKRTAL